MSVRGWPSAPAPPSAPSSPPQRLEHIAAHRGGGPLAFASEDNAATPVDGDAIDLPLPRPPRSHGLERPAERAGLAPHELLAHLFEDSAHVAVPVRQEVSSGGLPISTFQHAGPRGHEAEPEGEEGVCNPVSAPPPAPAAIPRPRRTPGAGGG